MRPLSLNADPNIQVQDNGRHAIEPNLPDLLKEASQSRLAVLILWGKTVKKEQILFRSLFGGETAHVQENLGLWGGFFFFFTAVGSSVQSSDC